MEPLLQGVTWLGHASFRIVDGSVVYIDPWKLSGGPRADVILVTHGHHDHLSVDDIALISGPETIVLCPPDCLAELVASRAQAVRPGDALQVAGVKVQVVPAYNTDKPNHPRSAGHVGYVVEIGGRRIYHAGDTDVIPEMSEVVCDVALLPMGGTYTMNAEQAAQAAETIDPQVVVPMHWGRLVGTEKDVERLRKLMPKGVRLVVMTPEQ
jgi:L-ascorbate metabolism protein UlaG (beta-lactamase superfamily)